MNISTIMASVYFVSHAQERSLSCAGNLLRIEQLVPVGVEATLKDVSDLADCDINPAAEFIRGCLRLDPDDRPTAAQLLEHPWMKGAEVCRDYRPPVVV
jgi:serine/threonine protein kinase